MIGVTGEHRLWGLVCALAVSACAARPAPPPALAQLAEVRTSPASREAEAWAPQAHARAVELEAAAQRALDGGDAATAAALAERAIAAHEQAWALARLARAERRRLAAEEELAAQRRILSELQDQQQRSSTEAAGLELRARAARAGVTLPAQAANDAERVRAQREGASALATQARLLCVAAGMLGADNVKPTLTAELDQLERALGEATGAGVLDTAARVRSACSNALSAARRERRPPSPPPRGNTAPSTPSAPVSAAAPAPAGAALPADALLAELSAEGLLPSRDERGVAIVLRNLFGSDGALTAAARAELERASRIARSHPDFPVLLVGHGSGAAPAELSRQLEQLSAALRELGVADVRAENAADRLPLLPPRLPGAEARNRRIELVFVAPRS